ncbi:RNase P modulator RnpM [Anaerococcus porci]|uniref:YlxR family protein n=1 Tax=Anaerococcus porci TaxID=2652269 RepID=A0A6N7VED9_9FIRM|nr:YlxR family protein [Anaerococcus porci]MDY3005938.1 YlxR family protein [Anaerococcus porci]MSS77241.1 YlxR family protein [Anaerococcus porci]
MKQRKIPQRKCIVCGENKDKNELIRIVKNKEEGIILDPTGKKNGRGAYICKDENCINEAKKKRKLEKVFKTEISDNLYEEIIAMK